MFYRCQAREACCFFNRELALFTRKLRVPLISIAWWSAFYVLKGLCDGIAVNFVFSQGNIPFSMKLCFNGNYKQNHSFMTNTVSWWTVRLNSFQKFQVQSVLTFFNLLLCAFSCTVKKFLQYLNYFACFDQVVVRFLMARFCYISHHSSFKGINNKNKLFITLSF